MTWLVIINKKDKIDLVRCYDYEYDDYNYFPDVDGRPIQEKSYDFLFYIDFYIYYISLYKLFICSSKKFKFSFYHTNYFNIRLWYGS